MKRAIFLCIILVGCGSSGSGQSGGAVSSTGSGPVSSLTGTNQSIQNFLGASWSSSTGSFTLDLSSISSSGTFQGKVGENGLVCAASMLLTQSNGGVILTANGTGAISYPAPAPFQCPYGHSASECAQEKAQYYPAAIQAAAGPANVACMQIASQYNLALSGNSLQACRNDGSANCFILTASHGLAPLSYEFTKSGTQAFISGTINTDNVLKVKFKVTSDQGNHTWQASELNVTIVVNGNEITPTYESSNDIYGQIGETSNVIDVSQYITPGVPFTITVKSPKNDFYCTYPYYNPSYGIYPDCLREVYSTHDWSGILTVQTSDTQSI